MSTGLGRWVRCRVRPTRLVTDLLLADEPKFFQAFQNPGNVVLVVEVVRIDTQQAMPVRVLAWTDLGSNA